jgi:TolB protein
MLFLIDPLGGRYLVATLAPPAPSSLAGWSGDGRRAILTTFNGSQTTVTQIDLTTGQTSNQFALGGGVSYTRPKGLAVLATSSTAATPTLQRYSMNGSLQQAYPTSFGQVGAFEGSVLSSPDGTQLVMGAAKGLALVQNDGTLVSQLPVAGATNCTVTRWWAPEVALASCYTSGTSPQLYEVPISGAAVTTLTAPPVAPDYGDLNAWEVGKKVYLQNAGACGSLFLGELQSNGTSSEVTVPDVDSDSSVVVIGTDGSRLALQATVSCGSGISAMWFNPAENTTSVVLGPPVNGGGVIALLAYPSPSD